VNIHMIQLEIDKMGDWWHKLIFLCNFDSPIDSWFDGNSNIEVVNLNLFLSERLLGVSKNNYPLLVEELLHERVNDKQKIYLLNYLDILFDPLLKTNPIRLLENLSKSHKIISVWPGRYIDGKLIYAESGHPEYFVSEDFEGEIIES
jgi:hypothetical protein